MTKSMCGADCWTDHPLIISKMKIRILQKQRHQGKPAPKRFNVSKLNRPSISAELTHTMEERTQHIQVTDDVEDSWTSFCDTMYAAAYETLGFTKRKHQDWFDESDEEITKLLQKKNRLHRAYVSDKSSASKAAFSNACKMVQKKLHEMQDTWLSQKAEEIQHYADTKDMKRFYKSVKTVYMYGPQPASSSPLLSTDGTMLINEKSCILERWAEHFDAVLNRPSHINEEAINRLPRVDINHEMDTSPTLPEVEKPFISYPVAKLQELMLSQWKFISTPGYSCTRRRHSRSRPCGLRELSLKTLKMHPWFTSTSRKAVDRLVTTTEEYHFSASLEGPSKNPSEPSH